MNNKKLLPNNIIIIFVLMACSFWLLDSFYEFLWYNESNQPLMDKLLPLNDLHELVNRFMFFIAFLIGGLISKYALNAVTIEKKRTEEITENLRITLNSIGDAVIATDKDGNITQMNPIAEKLTGWEFQIAKGRQLNEVFKIYNSITRVPAFNPVDKVLETGEIIGLANHTILVSKNGNEYQIADSAAPIINEEGTIVGVVLVFRDVTEEYKIKKQLKETSDELEHYFMSSMDLLSISSNNGYFIKVNYEWENIFNYSLEELQGTKIIDYVHPDDLANTITVFSKLEINNTVTNFLNRLKTKNGQYKWLEWRIKLIKNKIYTLARDITEKKKIEDNLKENEEKYRSLVQNVQGAVYRCMTVDPWLMLFVSDQILLLTGYTPNEFLENSITYGDVIHPEDREFVDKVVTDAIKKREVYELEYRIIHKSGETKWIFERGKADYDSNSNEKYLDGIFIDITEKKLNEKSIKQQNEIFTSLLDNLTSGVFMVEAPSGKPIIANPKALELLGRGILPDASKSNLSEVYKAYKVGTNDLYPIEEMPIIRGMYGEVSYIDDMIVVRPDGTEKNIEIYGAPVKDENGKVWASLVNFQDITERKNIEQKVLESENKFHTLFDSMTEMVVLHELVFNEKNEPINYRILDCNKAYTEVTGINKDKAINKLASEVYGVSPAPYLKEFTDVAITGELYTYTTYFAPMDKHFAISVVSPKKNQFATITSDITAMKQTEEIILTKNKELENYLYIASHDLRSPLVNIQGFSQRLQKQTDTIKNILTQINIENETKTKLETLTNENIPKTLDYIFTNVNKMDVLLNGLLQISRTGRSLMTVTKIDMNELIRNIIKSYNYQLSEINAFIKISEIPFCYGDQSLINQLFSNIIDNAIKYRNKEKQFILELGGKQEYKKVTYFIKDNGIGIEDRHIEKIWDVFYRVNPKDSEIGDGLGLSIIKRIVEKHKGKIWVESEYGNGTTFFIELLNNEFKI